jgi:CheY-like chemotaxis protein
VIKVEANAMCFDLFSKVSSRGKRLKGRRVNLRSGWQETPMAKTILLADDSITIQKIVNLTFSGEGFEVVTVGSGDVAIEKANDIRPDLVLADIFMPGKNGYEVCESIKNESHLLHIPVILLVGAFEPFDSREASRVKADGHLTKPFEIKTLISTVSSLIAASQTKKAPSLAHDEVIANGAAINPRETPTDFRGPKEAPSRIEEFDRPVAAPVNAPEVLQSSASRIFLVDPPSNLALEQVQRPDVRNPASPRQAEMADPEASPFILEDADPLGINSVDQPHQASGTLAGTDDVDSKSFVVDIWEPPGEVTSANLLLLDLAGQEASNVMARAPAGERNFHSTSDDHSSLLAPPLAGTVEETMYSLNSAPDADQAFCTKDSLTEKSSPAIASSQDRMGESDLQGGLHQAQLVDLIANKVIEKLSKEVIERIAWEVIPDLAEMMIKEHLESRFSEVRKT